MTCVNQSIYVTPLTRRPTALLPVLQRSSFLCFLLHLPASFDTSLCFLFWKAINHSFLVILSSHFWFQQPSEFLTVIVFLSLMAVWFSSNKRTISAKSVCIPSAPVCFLNLSVSLACVPVSVDYSCLTRFLQNTSKVISPALPSSSGQSLLRSPMPGAEFPKAAKMSTPQRPRLGTGFSEGEDILFFDRSPPPRPKLDSLAEAKKVTTLWIFYVLWRGG